MKTYWNISCILSLLFISQSLLGQNVLLLDSLTSLDNVLQEVSGLEYLNDKLIGHTDSGGENALYEISPANGSVERKIVISNASNIDWEDIAADDSYIYIGDFGNNNGDRQNLRVYRISQQDFFSSNTVLADTLLISYAEQTDFSPMRFQTNYDAEAMVVKGDSLYLFSKNWGNQRTYIYSFPKIPGTYALEIRDSLEVQGLITGADYDLLTDRLSLSAYTFTEAFFVDILNPSFPLLSQSNLDKTNLPFPSAFQLESICHEDSGNFYLATEGTSAIPAFLYSFFIDKTSSTQSYHSPEFRIYPNPVKRSLYLDIEEAFSYELFDLEGRVVLRGKQKEIDVSSLLPAYYWLKIVLSKKDRIDIRKILIYE